MSKPTQAVGAPLERQVRPLVERLRAGENFYAESSMWFDRKLAEAVDEAADEIERLHTELAAYRARKPLTDEQLDALAMDEDGYPDEEELQDIRDAAAFQPEDACALLEQVRRLWHWPNYATVTEAGDKLRHEFCTGGWSGNESLIAALEDNTMFWLRWWQLSERGGRYVFETHNTNSTTPPVG